MTKVTKTIVLDTSKEVLSRAFLPNALIVPFLIFLHWVAISLWYYYNYEKADAITNLIIGLLGGGFSVFTYFVWGLRRFLIKGYLIVHHNIIMLWLHPFCKNIAEKILFSDMLLELESRKSSIFNEWKAYLIDKSKKLPKILQKLIRRVLKKIGYSDQLESQIKLIKNKDVDEIANIVSDEIAYKLIEASNRLIPAQIIYLIPINIILIIVLWFI